MRKNVLGSVLALALVGLSATTVYADLIFTVSVDTSQLTASNGFTEPFGLDFELLTGGFSQNMATISDFNLSGGISNNMPSSMFGNSTGSLETPPVTLTSSASLGFADFNEGFFPNTAPLSTLSFKVDLTTNPGATPDSFSFYILENYVPNGGTPITTSDPFGSLVSVEITGSDSVPQAFTFGPNNSLPQVNVIPSVATPEPASLTLFAVGLAGLAIGRRWQRRREMAAA